MIFFLIVVSFIKFFNFLNKSTSQENIIWSHAYAHLAILHIINMRDIITK